MSDYRETLSRIMSNDLVQKAYRAANHLYGSFILSNGEKRMRQTEKMLSYLAAHLADADQRSEIQTPEQYWIDLFCTTYLYQSINPINNDPDDSITGRRRIQLVKIERHFNAEIARNVSDLGRYVFRGQPVDDAKIAGLIFSFKKGNYHIVQDVFLAEQLYHLKHPVVQLPLVQMKEAFARFIAFDVLYKTHRSMFDEAYGALVDILVQQGISYQKQVLKNKNINIFSTMIATLLENKELTPEAIAHPLDKNHVQPACVSRRSIGYLNRVRSLLAASQQAGQPVSLDDAAYFLAQVVHFKDEENEKKTATATTLGCIVIQYIVDNAHDFKEARKKMYSVVSKEKMRDFPNLSIHAARKLKELKQNESVEYFKVSSHTGIPNLFGRKILDYLSRTHNTN